MRTYFVYLASAFLFVNAMCAIPSCRQKQGKTDDEIRTSVLSTTAVIDSTITVSVKRGVVNLGGEVNDEETKTGVINAVKHIDGVRSIKNNMAVKRAALENESDRKLKNALDSILTSERLEEISVMISNGVVTLSGEITHEKERELVRKVGELHPRSIENQLKISDK
jgi:osmotically-inducible protein OsmY